MQTLSPQALAQNATTEIAGRDGQWIIVNVKSGVYTATVAVTPGPVTTFSVVQHTAETEAWARQDAMVMAAMAAAEKEVA